MRRPSFTEQRARWLAQLAADGELPACAYRVGIALTGHFNAETGDAWPSNARLADLLETHPRVVQKGLARLLAREHLTRDPGGGRGRTNVHRMNFHDDKARTTGRGSGDDTTHDQAPFTAEKPRPNGSETTHDQAQNHARSGRKPRLSVHPNLIGTSNEPRMNLGGRSRGSRMHPDAVLSDLWILEAEKIGALQDLAEKEFAKFRDYWIAQSGQRGVKADWSATWRNWIRRALESQQRANRRDPVSAGAVSTGRGPSFRRKTQ